MNATVRAYQDAESQGYDDNPVCSVCHHPIGAFGTVLVLTDADHDGEVVCGPFSFFEMSCAEMLTGRIEDAAVAS